jgi:uncharacterized protein YggE
MLKRLALVTFTAAALAAASTAGAAEFPDYPFIHTSGTGFVYVAPDLGEIDFEIALFNADPDAARQAVDARITAIRALLTAVAIPSGDVDIRDVRRDIRKGVSAADGTPQYELKCGVHIKVADLSKWKAVVGALIVMPDLDGFLIGFDASQREQLEAGLTREALVNARRRADNMAAAVGRKLGAISAVSSGDLKNVTRAVGLAGSQSVGYRAPARPDPDREGLLMIVPMKLSQSVDVIYRFAK